MPQEPTDNPFREAREPREITITFRVTRSEHDAIVAAVGTGRGAIKDLIREGLAIALENRRQRQKARKR